MLSKGSAVVIQFSNPTLRTRERLA